MGGESLRSSIVILQFSSPERGSLKDVKSLFWRRFFSPPLLKAVRITSACVGNWNEMLRAQAAWFEWRVETLSLILMLKSLIEDLFSGGDASLNSQFTCLNNGSSKVSDVQCIASECSDTTMVAGTVHRKPGRGDTALSVSCSRWNVVGVQGYRSPSFLFYGTSYISSITFGLSHFDSENVLMVNHLRRSLHERIVPLTNKPTSPFQVNEPLPWVVPVPPEEFQHSETALETLTCGYSCWDKCGLHKVILGTTGRKQGNSAKGALYPSTESSLCKKRLLELFVSLELEIISECFISEVTYHKLKERVGEYQATSKAFKASPYFSNWISKPRDSEAFSCKGALK